MILEEEYGLFPNGVKVTTALSGCASWAEAERGIQPGSNWVGRGSPEAVTRLSAEEDTGQETGLVQP